MPFGLRRSDRRALWIVGALVALAAVLVALSLDRPTPPSFAPSPTRPVEAGAAMVGPRVYTVDATSGSDWRYFDFSRGSVVDRPGPLDWDLAFRRFHVIANGGPRFAGAGGIHDLGAVPFDSVTTVPRTGYEPTVAGSDTTNPAIAKWYDYGFTSHLLSPKPHVYAIRTADGRYAKLELLGYYCPGARPGCVAFRYVYQGDGSTRVAPEPPAEAGR